MWAQLVLPRHGVGVICGVEMRNALRCGGTDIEIDFTFYFWAPLSRVAGVGNNYIYLGLRGSNVYKIRRGSDVGGSDVG